MENVELFENILDKNEKVVKVIKPNKFKYIFYSLFSSFLIGLMIWGFTVLTMFLSQFDEGGVVLDFVWYLIPIGCFVVQMLGVYLLTIIAYHNCYYAYTNSKILIRSGIIGIDFKSLDMRYIGALNVRVGFWDKILKQETGSITFGSNSSPVSQGQATAYRFGSVEKPYDLYKEMKEVVEDVKEKYRLQN